VIALRSFVDQLLHDDLQLAGFAAPPIFVYCYRLGERLLEEAREIS